MNLLALDTSTELASIAILVDNKLLYAEQKNQRAHGQWLLPALDSLLKEAHITLSELTTILFGCGPGSFTGLRVACSVAKGLAYAHDLPLVPVSSLSTIAWSAREKLGDHAVPVLAVLDARMQELYWSFVTKQGYLTQEWVNRARDIYLPEMQSLVLAGTGIDCYWEELHPLLREQIITKIDLFPNASSMIELFQNTTIKPVTIAQAQPSYVRNQVTQGVARG